MLEARKDLSMDLLRNPSSRGSEAQSWAHSTSSRKWNCLLIRKDSHDRNSWTSAVCNKLRLRFYIEREQNKFWKSLISSADSTFHWNHGTHALITWNSLTITQQPMAENHVNSNPELLWYVFVLSVFVYVSKDEKLSVNRRNSFESLKILFLVLPVPGLNVNLVLLYCQLCIAVLSSMNRKSWTSGGSQKETFMYCWTVWRASIANCSSSGSVRGGAKRRCSSSCWIWLE